MTERDLSILSKLKSLQAAGQLTGAFRDIPDTVYHHPECPGISSTSLKTIRNQSVRHWLEGQKTESDSMRLGTGVHCALLEPARFETIKTQYSDAERGKIQKMVTESKSLLTTASFEIEETEVSYFYQHNDLVLKCRVDALVKTPDGQRILDVKTTRNASARAFRSSVNRYDYLLSIAMYQHVVAMVTGKILDTTFLAVESDQPHCGVMYHVSPQSILIGYDQFKEALNIYRRYLETKQIIGYEAFQTI